MMEVQIYDRTQILRNLAGYLPITLFAAFLYFVFGAIGIIYLLRDPLGADWARIVAVAVMAVVVVIGTLLYVRFVVNRLAQSRLALMDQTFVVRGQTSRGLIEKQYALGDIQAIAIGEQLNAAERFFDTLRQLGVPKTSNIELVKDLKAGRLLIVDRAGRREVFHFVDKVFDGNSLLLFVAELSKRGVTISGPAESTASADQTG